MKKISAFFLSLFMLIASFCLFTGCANGDRYELTYISGLGISPEAYEYNYIDFDFEDNTYTLENKAKVNGIVCKQTGSFTEDEFGNVTITNNEISYMNYFLYYNETLSFSEDYTEFYVSANVEGVEVVMIYTKE